MMITGKPTQTRIEQHMENNAQHLPHPLDKYLTKKIREKIEQDFYTKINEQARLDNALRDPDFKTNPLEHVIMLADHGIMHVRDVADRVLHILSAQNGIHFPERAFSRLELMKGYGVMIAYLHDIGMIDATIKGRDMHPEFSAHAVYNDKFEDDLNQIWEENSGNLPWHLAKLSYKGLLKQPPRTILREMLALTCAHSSYCISTSVLNHPDALRREMLEILSHSLPYLWYQKQLNLAREKLIQTAKDADNYDAVFTAEKQAQADLDSAMKTGQISEKLNSLVELYYKDFNHEAYQWLIDDHPEIQELREDVIDTLRVLRSANAFRQRGSRLRSSGNYQIFLDQVTGNAIYSIIHHDQTFLLEAKKTVVAGEANIAATDFTEEGDLRIAFHRGTFMDPAALERVTFNVAVTINNVQDEMIESYSRPEGAPSSADYHKKHDPVYILLESTDDNPHFTGLVAQQLEYLNPALKGRIILVPSLQNTSVLERDRYLQAKELDWSLKERHDLLEKIEKSGHKIEKMDVDLAFSNVKLTDLNAGDRLIEARAPSSFVYIPLSEGLIGYPADGYQPFYSHAWVPLGNIGVIRGDIRSATIIAEQKMQVLIVPKETYLKHWHFTYSEDEFIKLINDPTKFSK